jgi:three-Cys-motif partner protein
VEPVSENAARAAPAARIAGRRVSGPGFKFDEVGDWSILKLNIIENYAGAYTKAFSKRGQHLRKYYIDGFSGAGLHHAKGTRKQIDGSPTRALRITPPFDHFYFIDLNKDKTDYLESLCGERSDVSIVHDDANVYLRRLLPTIQYKHFNRALCVLDPYGLDLDWDVIELAGKSQAVDLLLNFPVMAMNRIAIWRQPERAPPEGVERMNRFWGDESWRDAAYAESQQGHLWGDVEEEKQPNRAIVSAFRERLKKVGGFEYAIDEPLPMTNSKNAVVYYLFFASWKPVAKTIIEDIFKRARGGSMSFAADK